MSEDPGAVLITGCSSGIGHETREPARGQGLDRLRDRSPPRPDRATSPRQGCKTLALDVTDEDSMHAAVAAVEAERRRDRSARQQRRLQPVGRARDAADGADCGRSSRPTSSASCACASWSLPAMRRAGRGRIVNISSMGGKLTFPGGGAYHATKYAVEALSDALRWEVRGLRGPGRDRRAGPDHDHASARRPPARSRRPTRRPRPTEPDDPYASFNAAVGAATAGDLRGADGAPRRRARTRSRR